MLRSFYVAIFQSKRAGCLLESISIPKIHITFRKSRNNLSNKSTRFIIAIVVFNGNSWKIWNRISKGQLSNNLHNIRSQSWLRTCCSRYHCLIKPPKPYTRFLAKQSVASRAFVYTNAIFASQNACWAVPNPLHSAPFRCRLRVFSKRFYLYTIIGKIPCEEILKIAESIS